MKPEELKRISEYVAKMERAAGLPLVLDPEERRDLDELLRKWRAENWEEAAGERCSRCGKEAFRVFDHPTGRVCKSCQLWLLDNYITDGENVKAKIQPDGEIIIIREQTKGS